MNELTISGSTVDISANKLLAVKSKQIETAMKDTISRALKIARILKEIDEKEMYKSHFESIHEYAATMFGFKKNYVYKLLAISPFITKENKTIYDSEKGEYAAGQLIECSPLTTEQRKEHINIDIFPTMTAKEIREKVKSIKKTTAGGEDGNNENDVQSVDAHVTTFHKIMKNTVKKLADLISQINDGDVISANISANASAMINCKEDKTEVTITIRKEN